MPSNLTRWIVTSATVLFLALALYLPFRSSLFRFAPLPPAELITAFVLALLSVTWLETARLLRRLKKPITMTQT